MPTRSQSLCRMNHPSQSGQWLAVNQFLTAALTRDSAQPSLGWSDASDERVPTEKDRSRNSQNLATGTPGGTIAFIAKTVSRSRRQWSTESLPILGEKASSGLEDTVNPRQLLARSRPLTQTGLLEASGTCGKEGAIDMERSAEPPPLQQVGTGLAGPRSIREGGA
ncbi:hypothetical protein PG991_007808 [Apiospora marii]|uniref:Uncharacterized protein n=1 Tax=Apiospora marii TaxID=335849 RepID=A0ABR1RWJ6_9PEZI